MTVIASPFFMGERMHGFQVPEPHILIDPDLPPSSPQARMAVLYRKLADRVEQEDWVAVFAGDCVSIIGVLAGLERRGIQPTLVFYDAHGDFHTWDTTASNFVGGMPLAMVTGRGEQTVVDGAGLDRIPDDRAILVDGRDLDVGEDSALDESGVRQVAVEDIAANPPQGPLYVHVDLDVVDPLEMPAMNYPAPDGPSLDAVASSVRRLADTGRVVAFSLSGWNPELPGADRAARASLEIAAPFL